MLIGLGHKKRTGKDTIADYLVQNHGFKKIAFADGVREAVQSVFGVKQEQMLDGKLKEKADKFWQLSPRQMATGLGEALKSVHKEVWTKKVEKQLYTWMSEGHDVVVSDVRFLIEVKLIKDLGGWLIKVERPYTFNLHYSDFEKFQYKLFGRLIFTDKHVSETQLDTYKGFDWEINNKQNKKSYLFNQIDQIINHIRYRS